MGISISSLALDALLKENCSEADAISDHAISGIHRTVLWRYRTGRRKPDIGPATRLEKLSSGRVPLNGWEDLDPQPVSEVPDPPEPESEPELADATESLEDTSTVPGPDLVNPPHAPSSVPPPAGSAPPVDMPRPSARPEIVTPDPDGAV